MRKYRNGALLLIGILLLFAAMAAGCAKRPPVPYQQLQISDSEESKGYDVYLYIAIQGEVTERDVEDLLKWFDEVKYPEVNTIAVYVWRNPQAALMGMTGDLMASLVVNRSEGQYDLTINR